MRTHNIHHQSLARVAGELAARGIRRLLVTSTGSEEGKTTVVAELGRTLTANARSSAVLVDADAFKPTLHREFGLGVENGLGELLDDLYGVDLANEDPAQFGLGDWIELLHAQQRTGDLRISDGTHACSVRFVKGAVCCVAEFSGGDGHRLGDLLVARGRIPPAQRDHALAVQRETGGPLGDVLCTLGAIPPDEVVAVLHEQVSHRLQGLLRLRSARCEFADLAEPYLAVAGGHAAGLPETGSIDSLITSTLRAYLGDPFLSSQIPGYLRDTSTRSLKVLPAGTRPADLMAARHARPFRLLLERLGRVFDTVLIDVPPVSLLTPTASLATAVDAVLMVVRSARYEASEIRRAIEQLRQAGASIVGVVLTHVETPGESVLSPYYRVSTPRWGTYEEMPS